MKKIYTTIFIVIISALSHLPIIAQSYETTEKKQIPQGSTTPERKGDLLRLVESIYESYNLYFTGQEYYFDNERKVSPPTMLLIEGQSEEISIHKDELNDIPFEDIISIEASHLPPSKAVIYGTRGYICVIRITVKSSNDIK